MQKAQKLPLRQALRLRSLRLPPYHLISPHRRARHVFLRGETAKSFLLSWVDWHWGGYLGYSLCPWYWASTSSTCVHPQLGQPSALRWGPKHFPLPLASLGLG